MLTIEQVKQNGWLVFEAITGSKAYGLATATSDTDIRGVFVLPKALYYSLDYTPQVANESNDIVYYELTRFVELLAKNNPNMLEMLGIPDSCILLKDDIMNSLRPDMFLSKLCEKSFANYAFTQIKKAYGLEKKIMSPVEKERKSVLDFCFVYIDRDAIPLPGFLKEKGFEQDTMGLSAIPHLRDCYNLYYSPGTSYGGIVRSDKSNEVSVSHIPKGEVPVGLLYFNRDGYSVYCRKYKEYWEWVEKRNEERYRSTVSHGKKYDAKNMMHVFRLLLMAKEIATEGCIRVFRNDRDFLLNIKQGNFEYDELVKKAEQLRDELTDLYIRSNLPDTPDIARINEWLVNAREEYYRR
jgi:hypothetical protein